MTLQDLIQSLDLKVLTQPRDFAAIPVESGYAADLLSCVMTGAQPGGVWVTLQAHLNIVAVAALRELSAVIITEDAQPDAATIARANGENVTLLSTPRGTFEVAGRLWALGVRQPR